MDEDYEPTDKGRRRSPSSQRARHEDSRGLQPRPGSSCRRRRRGCLWKGRALRGARPACRPGRARGAQRPQLHVRVFTFPSMCDTSLRCCLDTSSTGTPSTPTLSPNKIKTPGCRGQPEGNGPPRATQHRPQGEPAPDLGSSAFSVGLSVLPGRAWHGPGARPGPLPAAFRCHCHDLGKYTQGEEPCSTSSQDG